jgi:hypothetical protein
MDRFAIRTPPSPAPERLAAPPRHVPLSVVVRLLLAGAGGWIWLGVASPLALAFLVKTDLLSWAVFRGELVTVPGVVVACERSGASEGGSRGRSGTPIYANRYRFGPEEDAREGTSFATGRCLEAGAAVSVEHPAGRPDVSRIAGMRRAVFGPEVAFTLVFPVVGLLLVGAGLRSGWRQLRLLRRGKLALGTLVAEEPTRISIDKRRVMKVRFAIETDRGIREEVVVRTHRTELVEDDARERILYDPGQPARAVAWDLLRHAPRLDAGGTLAPAAFGETARTLLAPAFAVATHVVAILLLR